MPAKKAVAKPNAVPAPAATPMEMLAIAVERGADVDQLTKLMELQERWEGNQARKAFSEAMTAFKADPPTIVKNKHVSFGTTSYDHATLDHVANEISKAMSPHGLSFRWDVQQNGSITVTCVIMHALGHEERVTLTAGADDSGKKNSIQQIGSTVTYLQRYTLLAATGLAAAGSDDDGRGSGAVIETIDLDQVAELDQLIKKCSNPDWLMGKIKEAYRVENLVDLRVADFAKAKKQVEGTLSKS